VGPAHPGIGGRVVRRRRRCDPRRHERAVLVFAATLLGLLPVVLLISEIALGKF
jgi:hypothetical protein